MAAPAPRRSDIRLDVEPVLALVAGATAFAIAAGIGAAARGHVPSVALGIVFLGCVLFVALAGGVLYALPVGIATIDGFDWFFLPPLRAFDWPTVLVLGLSLAMAVVVGVVATQVSRRALGSERARSALAEEQAALRRVATLVATGSPPDEVFASVAVEAARLVGSSRGSVARFEPDETFTVVAYWSDDGSDVPIGTQLPLRGDSVIVGVRRQGRPVRMDDFQQAAGPVAEFARRIGPLPGSTVAAPVFVDERLWGATCVSSVGGAALGADTEHRLLHFSELVATAIANTESKRELAASRSRIVSASDEARRRIERDLHDGTQQRLVTLALAIRTAESAVAAGQPALKASLRRIADGIEEALSELHEISRGIHPAILSQGGLAPALRTLARRSAVPVELSIADLDGRLDERVEVAAYYVVAETLANVVKHARASRATVHVRCEDGRLRIGVGDDGVGGADPSGGSGLVGLADRVEALGGSMRMESAAGSGTRIEVMLPVGPPVAIPGTVAAPTEPVGSGRAPSAFQARRQQVADGSHRKA